jgi:hypothetical protein
MSTSFGPCPPERASVAADTPKLSLDDQVKALLQHSRAAHALKLTCTGKSKNGQVIEPPNWPTAEAHIRDAIRHREQAEALDPQHTAPAWAEDQAANKGQTSAAMQTWFRHYLTIP